MFIISFKRIQNIFLFLVVGMILFPSTSMAAILYLDSLNDEYKPGDVFGVEIKIETEQECINAVDVQLAFSKEILEVVDFSFGQSIIDLLIRPADLKQDVGVIVFSGGITGGYCGRIPGDPGESNLLAKVIFRLPGMTVGKNQAKLAKLSFLDSSKVLLNDGLGTQAELTTRGMDIIITDEADGASNEWRKEMREDSIPPESFAIELGQEEMIFDGKYFIIFITTDKQTGMDYYQVQEGTSEWQDVISPYLLENQKLSDIIKIRAVDKAGNTRVVEYYPMTREEAPNYDTLIAILSLAMLIIGASWFYKKRIRND